jgi:hypothetical protein
VDRKFLHQTQNYIDLCTIYTPAALSALILGILWEPLDHLQPKIAIHVMPPLYPTEAQHLQHKKKVKNN